MALIDPKTPLAHALARKGMSANALARALGTSRQNVSRWAGGAVELPRERAREVAQILDVTPEYLILSSDETTVTHVPLVSFVQAGRFTGQEPVSDDDELRKIQALDLPKGDWLAFEVVGDSMDRVSPPGSIIFVNRRERELFDNKLYVVTLETGEGTYKRYKDNPPRFEPVSANRDHETFFPTGRVRVIGRVRRSVYDIQ